MLSATIKTSDSSIPATGKMQAFRIERGPLRIRRASSSLSLPQFTMSIRAMRAFWNSSWRLQYGGLVHASVNPTELIVIRDFIEQGSNKDIMGFVSRAQVVNVC